MLPYRGATSKSAQRLAPFCVASVANSICRQVFFDLFGPGTDEYYDVCIKHN